MDVLEVSCAIIERGGTILLARRGPYMALPLAWEFPGGKLRPGESTPACLVREIREELGVTVRIVGALPPSRSSAGDGQLVLHPFICRLDGAEPAAREHSELRWVPPGEASHFDLAEADVPVLAAYLGFPARPAVE